MRSVAEAEWECVFGTITVLNFGKAGGNEKAL